MASKLPKTQRLQVRIALKTHAYLVILGDKGVWGVGSNDAAKTLIEQGIRRAIRQGLLTAEDVNAVEGPDSSPE
jgi:hypothetical protein